MPRGSFYSRQAGQLTVVDWNDSKVMMLLSTAHQGHRNCLIHQVERKPVDDGGRRPKTAVPAPRQAIDYTISMGGVDRTDQLRSYYTCSWKFQKWWKKLMYFLIDVCRVNAWLSYIRHHPATHITSTSASG
ncbi:uncharacterized protein LOC119723906 [Patiria miniata]|uniref:PiggyBac transposable element-derived protein domain-containing protein n=1 Tax=Patiria miniata TaxID=46514 RepID=A0A913ZI68_PATMI|nr:uncharacterized protein LOC119723906 [Patiria miniata]